MHSRFENIRLAGVCAAVPKKSESISELMAQADSQTRFTLKRVAALAGLENRHVAPKNIYSGDLAIAAGRELLRQLDWNAESVDALFFVTQTPDFLSPPTGFLIAAALGLSEKCAVTDTIAGCPGLIQGAWLACGQMGHGAKRVLVLSGDTPSKVIPEDDIGNSVLMGDAVGALALEWDESAPPVSFHLLSWPDVDFNLVNYNSGYRQNRNSPDGMIMNGNRITEFCLNRVPQCLEEHLEAETHAFDDIDVFYLHQPNRMILNSLQRRLKMEKEKLPLIFADYANCSSASLAINVCRHAQIQKEPVKAFFCAFGSGLAVASILAEWDPCRAFGIVEVEEGSITEPSAFKGPDQ